MILYRELWNFLRRTTIYEEQNMVDYKNYENFDL